MNVIPQYTVIGPYNYDRIIIIYHDFLPTMVAGFYNSDRIIHNIKYKKIMLRDKI